MSRSSSAGSRDTMNYRIMLWRPDATTGIVSKTPPRDSFDSKEPWEQVICMLDDLDSALIQFEVHLVVGVVELPPWRFGNIQNGIELDGSF